MKIKKSWLLLLMAGQLAALNLPLLRDYWVRLRGQEFNFAVRPVDPRDPFRGRYVSLGFALVDQLDEHATLNCADNSARNIKRGAFNVNRERPPIYLQLGKDGENLAKVVALGFERPSGDNYLTIRDYYCDGEKVVAGLLAIPFNRYYVNERRAPEIEENLKDSQLTVTIYRGNYSVRHLGPRDGK